MEHIKNLAIVIPAYKSTFLAAALDSIAAQTCQDFTLYIGDDCSPHNLEEIVTQYRDKVHLVYKRFDTNLGGKDLVAQWERCIDMTQDEEWIWLFSDDDVMEPRCVEEFYKAKMKHPEAGLFHFNIKRLYDATGVVEDLPIFPKHCSAKCYLDEKLKGNFKSFVVEFIVRRDVFFKCGRFQNYDLAWGSDFISWVKFADAAGGIHTCENANVIWRYSNENISPDKSLPVTIRKIRSLTDNAQWIADYTQRKAYGNKWFYTKYPLGEIKRNRKLLPSKEKRQLLDEYCEKINPSFVVRCIIWGLKYCI